MTVAPSRFPRRERRALARLLRKQLERDLRPRLGGASPRRHRTQLTALATLLVCGGAASEAGAAINATISGAGNDKLLTIAITAGSPVAVTCEGNFPSGDVQVNGSDVSPATPCADFGTMSVTGDGAADDVDLSGLDFVDPYTVTIVGGAGNDTLVGSPSGFELFTGGSGTDSVVGDFGTNRLVEQASGLLTLTTTAFTSAGQTDSLADIDGASLTGGAGGDTLEASAFGGFEGVSLDGSAGPDLLEGSPASDTLTGGFGNDTIDPNQGSFEELFESGDVDMTLHPTSMTGGLGTDTFPAGPLSFDNATLVGGAGDNTIITSTFNRAVNVDGGAGGDTLTGGGADRLTGGLGNDSLEAVAFGAVLVESADVNMTLTDTSLTGGLGTDTLDGMTDAQLTGGPGNNTINASGWTRDLTVTGAAGNDTVTGGSGFGDGDAFLAEAGNDSLIGGPGANSFGQRNTIFPLDEQFIGSFTLTNTSLSGPAIGTDTISNFQYAQFAGGGGDDSMDASAFSGSTFLLGRNGDDTLKGGTFGDSLFGQNDTDELYGGAGADSLRGWDTFVSTDLYSGGANDDTIRAEIDSQDTIDGGGQNSDGSPKSPGDLLIDWAQGSVTLTAGNMQVDGALGDYNQPMTSIEQVSLTGDNGDDRFDASAFPARGPVFGGSFPTVTLDGGGGDDTLIGTAGDDDLDGDFGDGGDRLQASGGSFTLTNTQLTGQGTDTVANFDEASLTGGAGVDAINAGAFSSPTTLRGGAANDTLTGGSAADSLDGEGGVDDYHANGGDDTLFTQDLTPESIINCGPGTELVTSDSSDVLNADCGPGNPTVPGGGGDPTVPGGGGTPSVPGGGGAPVTPTTPPPDVVAATRPGCFNIPSVARNRTIPLPGGGRLVLSTTQVDDPVNPLRVTARLTGARGALSFKVNGRTITPRGSNATVPAGALRIGSRRNRVDATVRLPNGRSATATQFLVVLRCPLPVVTCKRSATSLSCASRTPLGAVRVKASLINPAGRTVASGSAPVRRGRYTATLRGRLTPGRYQYRHVATTRKRGEKLLMVRVVNIT